MQDNFTLLTHPTQDSPPHAGIVAPPWGQQGGNCWVGRRGQVLGLRLQKPDSHIHWRKFCVMRAFCWILTIFGPVYSEKWCRQGLKTRICIPFSNIKGSALNIVEVLLCSTFTVTLAAESTCVLKCDSIISELLWLHTEKRILWLPRPQIQWCQR